MARLAWLLPAGDAPPVPFLPILPYDPPQLPLRPCVDQLLGRQPGRGAHAHVQGARPREAEPALRPVQLQQAVSASEHTKAARRWCCAPHGTAAEAVCTGLKPQSLHCSCREQNQGGQDAGSWSSPLLDWLQIAGDLTWEGTQKE